MMKVALIYSDALKRGGYPRDIRWLASTLTFHNINVTLFYEGGDFKEGLNISVKIDSIKNLFLRISEFEIIHILGFFVPEHVLILKKLSKYSRPVILSPLSQLLPFALDVKRYKKRLYIKVLSSFLKNVTFHVLSPFEKQVVSKYFPYNNFFEAPLGIYPLEDVIINNSEGKTLDNKMELIFFGRNDIYQKGIDVLLESFSNLTLTNKEIHLTIAGNSWKNSEQYIREKISSFHLQERVTFLSSISEEKKRSLFINSDYLIYLSRFDGPPRPIREALAFELPVIVSPQTNMGHLVQEFNAGIQVPLDPDEICNALSLLSHTPALHEIHKKGVRQLKSRLSWKKVAADYIMGYQSVLKAVS